MKNNRKAIIVNSVLALLLCSGIAVGSTYALFTSEENVNIAINSGKVDVEAKVENLKIYSLDVEQKNTFENGGTALINGSNLVLSNITPGDKVEFDIVVKNNSNVNIQKRTIITSQDDGLFSGLEISIGNYGAIKGYSVVTNWEKVEANTGDEIHHVIIQLPVEAGNEYSDKSCSINLAVEAIQGNADVDEYNTNAIKIYNNNDLLLLAEEVNNGNYYTGQEIELLADLDLDGIDWTPIGITKYFDGKFDGNGHTIKNLSVDRKGKAGLFASLWTSAEITDLVVDEATIIGTNHVGAIAASGYGKIADCTVSNSNITSNLEFIESKSYWDNGDKAGAIIGYASGKTVTDCKSINNTITAYRDLGGLIGAINEEFKDVSNNEVTNANVNYYTVPQTLVIADGNTNVNRGPVVGRINTSGLYNKELTAEYVLENNTVNGYTEGEVAFDAVTPVNNIDGLLTAFATGGKYEIVAPLEITNTITVSENTTLYNNNDENVITFAKDAKIETAPNVDLALYGIMIEGNGSFEMKNNEFTYDSTKVNSDAILKAKAGSTLTLGKGTTIQNVLSSGAGVAWAKGEKDNRATIIIEGATIQNCAGGSGTAINVDNYGDVYIEEGTKISNNISYNSQNHGIIRIYNPWDAENVSTLTMNGGEISNNYFSGNGSIGLYYGKMTMNGGKICDNSWYSYNGKTNGFYCVVYVHSNSQFIMNNGEISENIITNGAINSINSSIEGAITLNGGTITNNYNTRNSNKDALAAVCYPNSMMKSIVISSNANVSGTIYNHAIEGDVVVRNYSEISEFFEN